MTSGKKGALISLIVTTMKAVAISKGDRNFCEGDMFFALAFKSDKELLKIAKAAGI